MCLIKARLVHLTSTKKAHLQTKTRQQHSDERPICAFPWHILCLPVAHGILFPLVKNCKSRIASQELQVKDCKSRIASQGLPVKNCKSRIASQELQVKNCKSRIAKKSLLDSLDIFFSRLNE
jgi:hypothetical protein